PSAVRLNLGFRASHEVEDLLKFVEGNLFSNFDVGHQLRITLPATGQLGQSLSLLLHRAENLQRRNQAVPGRRSITENEVPALFPAQVEVLSEHVIDDIF